MKYLFIFLFLIVFSSIGFTQEKEKKERKNLNTYTPSVLLSKGQLEVKLYNNLYTQINYYDNNGNKVSTGRSSYLGNFIQVLYGTGNNGRINWGFDVNIRSVRLDNDNTSPFDILNFESATNTRTTLSSLGPKIKFAPFKNIDKLSVQSSVWVPVSKNMENEPWLAWQKVTWWTQVFYDHKLSQKFNLFSEIDILVRLKTDNGSKSHIMLPLSAFLSYFPNSKSTVYIHAQYGPRVSMDGFSYYAQAGVGAKFQLFPSFELEVSASNFFVGKNEGAGGTMNLGLRYLK